MTNIRIFNIKETINFIEAYKVINEFGKAIICGSYGLFLHGFDLSHEPEDLDLLIDPNTLENLYNSDYIVTGGSYSNSFKTIINGINVDLIVRDISDNEHGLIYVANTNNTVDLATKEHTLFGKLHCCLYNQNNSHQIDELIYILQNNKDLI